MVRIVTLTMNPAIDKSCSVERVVANRKLRCSQPRIHPGGGGLNVARAVHVLGGEAHAYWTCGGALGEVLKRLLDEEGVNHHPVPVAALTRENLIVLDQTTDQQYRFGLPGSTLDEQEIESCIGYLTSLEPTPEYLVLSGSLPPGIGEDFYARIIAVAPSSCRVILDTSQRPLELALESGVYLVKPNLHELERLVSGSVETEPRILDAARTLIQNNSAQVVVVSLGAGGVMLVTADSHLPIRAPTVRIRSRVGAGDSTVAGIVLALSQGKSIEDAARLGVAAGTAAVMTEGTELCRREDVEQLYREISGLP
ncbi:MAG: 1-phosphofructokinase family hexose kinase [Pseudohongiellaceae bacterium]